MQSITIMKAGPYELISSGNGLAYELINHGNEDGAALALAAFIIGAFLI